jgi:DNA-binding response OmpR family regulator
MPTAIQTRILVVDDDEHFRETLIDAMALKDVEVEGVTTGKEALEILEARRPSLILMDVQLPDMHGFELCRRIKRSGCYEGLPIVFLSAKYTEPGDRAEGLLIGADAYLSKPIHLEVLWDEIHDLLDKGE